jgi:hypothetical protein
MPSGENLITETGPRSFVASTQRRLVCEAARAAVMLIDRLRRERATRRLQRREALARPTGERALTDRRQPLAGAARIRGAALLLAQLTERPQRPPGEVTIRVPSDLLEQSGGAIEIATRFDELDRLLKLTGWTLRSGERRREDDQDDGRGANHGGLQPRVCTRRGFRGVAMASSIVMKCQPTNLYPSPYTDRMKRGSAGSASSFCRSRRM